MRQTGPRVSLLERVRTIFAGRRAQAGGAGAARRRAPIDLNPSISGASFSLVGLTELREQLGERWPELSARVHDLATAVIQRNLTRGDVFDVQGEDGYVILFDHLTNAQAEFKCRVIAKEIAAKLLGADWVGRSAESVVFELPEAALAAPSFEAALDAAISRGRVLGPLGEEPSPALEVVPGDPVAPQGRLLAGVSIEPEGGLRRETRSAAHVLKPIERGQDDAAYSPVWEFGAEALLRFRFRAKPLAPDASISDVAKADIAALSKVVFDVGRLLQTGRRLPVICPLRLDTLLRDAWRPQIVRMLREAPPPLRKLVTLEVAIGPEHKDWLGPLERACRALPAPPAACVPLQQGAVPSRASAVVKHLNLALSDTFAASKSGIGVLFAFVQRAERVGMTCGVTGLRTRPAVLAATAAGFQQLSGPAVHGDVASLGQAVHFDLKSLYRDLFRDAG